MKEKGLGTKLLMAALTLVVVAYFGLQAVRYFGDPLTTTLAYSYQATDGQDLSGFVVRQEQVLPDDTNGLLQLRRAEGERVSKGGTVAAVYADQASLDRQSEIENLEIQLEQLQYAQDAAVGAEAALKLDSQIVRSMRELQIALEENQLNVAEDVGASLRAQVLKRDYNSDETVDLAAEIQNLQGELKTLRGQTAKSTRQITAPVSGLYSAAVDGYEEVLTPASVVTMTPSQLTALRSDPTVQSGVGKLILGDAWYYAAPMPVEEAQALQDQEEDGKKLTLYFAKSMEQSLPVRIHSIGAAESGRCIVVFQGRTHLAQLTLLRQQSARVISSGQEGLRIPKEALHATETRLDRETGEQIREKATGVYCVVGKEAWFKPVEVVYNGDGFLLVKSTAEKEEDRLRPGDQVIVTAKGLYDGKVVR